MRALLTLPLFLLLISGCSIHFDENTPISLYYLQPNIKPACKLSSTKKVVLLNFIDGSPSVYTKDITYTKSDLKAGSYLYSKWIQFPNDAITTALYTAFKHNNIFQKLVHEDTAVQSELILEVKVLKFEHHFVDEEHSYALIELDAVLYNSQTLKILESSLFNSKVKTDTNNAKGGVKALNKALGNVLSDLVCWSAQQSSKY